MGYPRNSLTYYVRPNFEVQNNPNSSKNISKMCFSPPKNFGRKSQLKKTLRALELKRKLHREESTESIPQQVLGQTRVILCVKVQKSVQTKVLDLPLQTPNRQLNHSGVLKNRYITNYSQKNRDNVNLDSSTGEILTSRQLQSGVDHSLRAVESRKVVGYLE